MHIPAQLLPAWTQWLCGLVLLAAIATALYRAQWGALRAQPARVHLVAGGAVACLLLWLLNIRAVDGLVLHFLAMTTFTLVVGWSFSVLAAGVSLVGLYLLQGLEWGAYPLSTCLTVLLPATVTRLLASAVYRRGLRHPFFYFLGVGFAGGALCIAVLAAIAVGLFALLDISDWVAGALEWWPLIFLLMFSEGFINGMCVSALAVFYPQGVKTFDERFFFDENRGDRGDD